MLKSMIINNSIKKSNQSARPQADRSAPKIIVAPIERTYVCRVGFTCKDDKCRSMREHPKDKTEITVKDPVTNTYSVQKRKEQRCPDGINCLKFDTINVRDKQDSTRMIAIKIWKCEFTEISHRPCNNGQTCPSGVTCEFYHSSEELQYFRDEKERLIRLEQERLEQIEQEKRLVMEEARKQREAQASKQKELDVSKNVARFTVKQDVFNYLVVQYTGQGKAEVVGEIKCKGNPKTKGVEPVIDTFQASKNRDRLHIQNVFYSKVRGDKGTKLKMFFRRSMGEVFVAQYGSNNTKCEILDQLPKKFYHLEKSNQYGNSDDDDDLFERDESDEEEEDIKIVGGSKSRSNQVVTQEYDIDLDDL